MAKGDRLYYRALHLAEQKDYDYQEVLHLLNESIILGNKKASYALATWYLNGFHVRKNYKKGFSLLQTAVQGGGENNFTGYKDALSDIAVCYELGNGVHRDKHKAYYYYFLAALNGDIQAKQELSRCLYYGIGIAKDIELSSLIDEFVL
jgi:TPR repeat protein